MNARRLLTACAAACMALPITASATPSTQIWIPSTDIQAFLKPHIGWDIYLNAYGDGIISNGGLTIGVLPTKKIGLELGVDYRDLSGDHTYPWYLNAKLGLPEDAFFKHMPAFAIGIYDLGLKKDVSAYNVSYALLAKTIWKLGRFSFGGYKGGIGTDPKALWLNKDGEVQDMGALASWDRVMSELTDKLWLAIDFQSGSNGYGAISVGASYNFAKNASVIVGYDYFLNPALKPTVTVQFDINAWAGDKPSPKGE